MTEGKKQELAKLVSEIFNEAEFNYATEILFLESLLIDKEITLSYILKSLITKKIEILKNSMKKLSKVVNEMDSERLRMVRNN